jgi:XTP/dITP diphosphohydrolase
VPTGHEQTFAEMEAGLKNRLSHRARAWARLAEWVRMETPQSSSA